MFSKWSRSSYILFIIKTENWQINARAASVQSSLLVWTSKDVKGWDSWFLFHRHLHPTCLKPRMRCISSDSNYLFFRLKVEDKVNEQTLFCCWTQVPRRRDSNERPTKLSSPLKGIWDFHDTYKYVLKVEVALLSSPLKKCFSRR
jgi:hypothetical protein